MSVLQEIRFPLALFCPRCGHQWIGTKENCERDSIIHCPVCPEFVPALPSEVSVQ